MNTGQELLVRRSGDQIANLIPSISRMSSEDALKTLLSTLDSTMEKKSVRWHPDIVEPRERPSRKPRRPRAPKTDGNGGLAKHPTRNASLVLVGAVPSPPPVNPASSPETTVSTLENETTQVPRRESLRVVQASPALSIRPMSNVNGSSAPTHQYPRRPVIPKRTTPPRAELATLAPKYIHPSSDHQSPAIPKRTTPPQAVFNALAPARDQPIQPASSVSNHQKPAISQRDAPPVAALNVHPPLIARTEYLHPRETYLPSRSMSPPASPTKIQTDPPSLMNCKLPVFMPHSISTAPAQIHAPQSPSEKNRLTPPESPPPKIEFSLGEAEKKPLVVPPNPPGHIYSPEDENVDKPSKPIPTLFPTDSTPTDHDQTSLDRAMRKHIKVVSALPRPMPNVPPSSPIAMMDRELPEIPPLDSINITIMLLDRIHEMFVDRKASYADLRSLMRVEFEDEDIFIEKYVLKTDGGRIGSQSEWEGILGEDEVACELIQETLSLDLPKMEDCVSDFSDILGWFD